MNRKMNNIKNIANKYAEKRSLISNANNGYAYIGCVIGNLKRRYVLCVWNKPV